MFGQSQPHLGEKTYMLLILIMVPWVVVMVVGGPVPAAGNVSTA